MVVVFKDRTDAGRQLAQRLEFLRGQDVVILGLPRGGVPVGFEVARALGAPLDVIVVRKLGVPYQPELAMGAIGEGGFRVLNERVLAVARVSSKEFRTVEEHERAILDDRVARVRGRHERLSLTGRTAVIVDDGIATGSTAKVACQVARQLGAAKVVLAVPVCAAETVATIVEADQVICVSVPTSLVAVGNFYRDFSPTSDDEVARLLDAARNQGEDHPG